MTTELYVLLPLTFVAAMLNASVGGGGPVLIPGLLALFPTTAPAVLFATEKCGSVVGQATASIQYARRMPLPWGLLLMSAGSAFFGAHLGARAIAVLPSTWVKPFVVFLLIVMLIYTWFKPDFGKQDKFVPISRNDQSQRSDSWPVDRDSDRVLRRFFRAGCRQFPDLPLREDLSFQFPARDGLRQGRQHGD